MDVTIEIAAEAERVGAGSRLCTGVNAISGKDVSALHVGRPKSGVLGVVSEIYISATLRNNPPMSSDGWGREPLLNFQ